MLKNLKEETLSNHCIYNMHICILNQILDFLRVANAENTKIVYNPKAFNNFERLSQRVLKDDAERYMPG